MTAGSALDPTDLLRELVRRRTVSGQGAAQRDALGVVADVLRERASHLEVTTGTVKAHVTALLAKLGVRDRVQATIVAYNLGLVRPG